jgi:hypothetical protein
VKTTSTVLLLTCLLLLGAADAGAHRLGKGGAREAAEGKAREFEFARSWLDFFEVNRCARKSPLRVDCVAVVSGDTETKSSSCRLLISVRAVRRRHRWDEVARVAHSRCRSLPIPVLNYADARKAIQERADRFAGQPTSVISLTRVDAQTYWGRAEWKRTSPRTESCSAKLKARRGGDDIIRAHVEGSTCH